ncbi:MAG: hypothetical protein GY861_26430 [bacterium]|nr:hypothetical protein [bacterium]
MFLKIILKVENFTTVPFISFNEPHQSVNNYECVTEYFIINYDYESENSGVLYIDDRKYGTFSDLTAAIEFLSEGVTMY